MPLAEDHGASRFSPCFFSPYHECFLIDPPEEVEKDGNDNDDVKELSEKAKERLERAQPLFLLSCYFRTYGSSYNKIARKHLIEHRPDFWQYLSISEAPPAPHFRCEILYTIVGDDQHLLRGELLTIIRLIRARLKIKSVRMTMMGHIAVPYMKPRQARILQGHFDGNELIVHCGKLYDFSEKNDEARKLFMQWQLSRPVGKTKMNEQ
ncbi:hypothetical protein VTN96DRAFT_10322 [Rasamsonia emersonii]